VVPAYPKTAKRIIASLSLFGTGWILCFVSMFVPATRNRFLVANHDIGTAWDGLVATLWGAIAFPSAMKFSIEERSLSFIWYSLTFMYASSILILWIPAVFRLPSLLLWAARLVSLGMLLAPWHFVWFAYTHEPPPPGPGFIVWAVGSAAIGLSPWLMPPKQPGEPWFTFAIFSRYWKYPAKDDKVRC